MSWRTRIRDLACEAIRVSPAELARIVPFAFLAGLGAGGLAIGTTVSSSLFLVYLGPENLAVLYLGMPVLMALYTPLSSFLLRRFGIGTVYRGTLSWLAVGGAFLALAFHWSSSAGAEPAAALLFGASFHSGLWYIALYTLFWSFAGDFFDIREAKRLFPLLTASMAFGASIGGLAVAVFSRLGLVAELYLIWALTALMARFPLEWSLRHVPTLEPEDDEVTHETFGEQLREVGRSFLRVRYVTTLSLLMFVGMVLASLCHFESLAILAANRDEAALAALLGQVLALVYAFNVVVNLLVFNRLVARLGVPRTALILPIAYLGVFGAMVVEPVTWVGVAGFFVIEGLLWSVDLNNQNLLLNALPTRTRRDLRLLLEGLAEPLATAAVGLGLWLFLEGTTTAEDLRLLARAGVAGALVAVVLVILVHTDYLRSMVVNLRQHWLDFSRPEEAVLCDLDREALAGLDRRLDLDDPDGTCLALRILWLNDRSLALDRLLSLLLRADRQQSVVLAPMLGEVLAARDVEVIHRVMTTLGPIRRQLAPAILIELGRHRLFNSRRFSELAEGSLEGERCAAAVGLLNAWAPGANRRGLEIVETLLAGDTESRRLGLRALGRSGQERWAASLLPYLGDPDSDTRQAALEALRELATPRTAYLLPALIDLLASVDEPVQRRLTLDNLAILGDPELLEPMLRQVESYSPRELRQCGRIVQSMGLEGVPRTIQVLRDPGFPYQARSIAARALGKLAPGQLEALLPELIETELGRAEEAVGRSAALANEPEPTPGLVVLHRFYRDQPREPVDFILELLSIGGRLPDYELLASSLRSQNPRLRGDAIEALEQGLERSVFLRLLPQVSVGSELGDLTAVAGVAAEGLEAIALRALDSRHPLELSAALELARESTSAVLGAAFRGLHRDSWPAEVEELLDGSGDSISSFDKLTHLVAASFFDPFEIAGLVPLARRAEIGEGERGTTLDLQDDEGRRLALVLEGALVSDIPGGQRRWGPGEVAGSESLRFGWDSPNPVVSEAACWLSLPVATLLTAARNDPHLAQQLLELRNPTQRTVA